MHDGMEWVVFEPNESSCRPAFVDEPRATAARARVRKVNGDDRGR